MGVEDNTFQVSSIQNEDGEDAYALHSDDKSMHLSFDYAVWVNTGGRENRLGFYSDGLLRYSVQRRCLSLTDEKLEEILLD